MRPCSNVKKINKSCPVGFWVANLLKIRQVQPAESPNESRMQADSTIHRPLQTAKVTGMTQQYCSLLYLCSSLWLLHCDLLK